MRKIRLLLLAILFVAISSGSIVLAGETGKISGIIKDKTTGEPLYGASVLVVGTSLGAVSDIEGHYTILYVPPGTYQIQISFIGYRKTLIEEVIVHLDQNTRVDVEIEPQTINLNEMIVIAERKAIKRDVATSVVEVSSDEIKDLPVANVTDVVGLQAGIRNFNIRGGGSDKILFMLNGITLRDPRNNEAVTKIALSSVKEVSVERGGFNAEYGQVQNGIVNVVTREGNKKSYSGNFQFRYSPPHRKYWNGSSEIKDISDPMSYVLRPFFDDAVCWTGTTNGAWDEYTRKQYPEFAGWNEISKSLCTDNNPNNDLTPLGAQRAFEYEIRKKQPNNQPDYDIDAGFGGPVPVVSDMLGNLRFFTSYISTRQMLLWPLSRPDYREYSWTLQVNSDIAENMRLRLSTLYSKRLSMRGNWDGLYYNYIQRPDQIASNVGYVSDIYSLSGLFGDAVYSPSEITDKSFAGKFTHTLSSNTFYEISVEHFSVSYKVEPSALRDTSIKYEIFPGYFEDSNPFGFWPYDSQGMGVILKGGGSMSSARDHSIVNTTSIKADFTSQVNFQNLVKAGIEFNYNDLDLDYGTMGWGQNSEDAYSTRTQMRVFPVRGSTYIQDKLETQEFILNAGLRLDYSNSNSQWYDIDPFNVLFYTSDYNASLDIPKKESKAQWQLSPRLGIAHPITENAKLFFNYGHFKQVPNYENMFRVGRNSDRYITSVGNPNLVLSKTISYELGFDYSIEDELLLQVAAYYNDVTDQQTYITYKSSSTSINYTNTSSNNYSDTRGFELTIRKNSGRWWSGFANYTYQVNTSGHFGSAEQYDNPSEQKKYDDQTVKLYQDRPIPQPFARANISLYTPEDFGPVFLGHNILGGFMLNVLFDWQDGYWATWNPKGRLGISYNVQSVDYYNFDMRIDKRFNIGKFSIDLFADISNVLNTKRLWGTDDQAYMESLHLPKSDVYDNIPGNDKVGDYRTPGAEYQPIEYQAKIDPSIPGKERPYYYEGSTGKYYEYKNQQWKEVDKARIDKVLEDKAYIDMPNPTTFWFLNPRNIYFGVRLSFNIFD
jgi:outer membrane receptor protein involved in Fe transport